MSHELDWPSRRIVRRLERDGWTVSVFRDRDSHHTARAQRGDSMATEESVEERRLYAVDALRRVERRVHARSLTGEIYRTPPVSEEST